MASAARAAGRRSERACARASRNSEAGSRLDGRDGTTLTAHLPLDRERLMIRVVIAEDQAMVLGALAALLEIERDISVVAQARDGKAALALAHGRTAGRRADRHRDAGA